MKQLPYLPRGARWTVPAAVAAATAGGMLAGSLITPGPATPRLPARSAAQLLAEVTGTAQDPPLTGTITETASLGLPAPPDTGILGSPGSPASLLAGSHTIEIWYSGPDRYRIAVPQQMSEEDLVRNGASAWLWDSAANTVTRFTPPAAPVPRLPLTPRQAAAQALARVGATTVVSVDGGVTVAGQPAYQLVLAPRGRGSLIGQVRIAIDSRNHVPLRVQVFARGAAGPAAEVGFTAVSFTPPPASDDTFALPAGARVVRQRAATAAGQGRPARAAAGAVRMIGTGWLTVADLPPSALSALAGVPGGPELLPFRHSSSKAASPSAGGGRPPGGAVPDAPGSLLGAVLNSATPVSGSWGSGRLLRTSLLSVLITNGGRVLIGAVTPQVLYHAATQAGRPVTAWGRHTASSARAK